MKENSEYLFNLLHNEKGYLYVCGWVMCKCTNSLSLTHFLLLKLNTTIKWFSLAYKIHLLYTPSYDGRWWQQLTSSATEWNMMSLSPSFEAVMVIMLYMSDCPRVEGIHSNKFECNHWICISLRPSALCCKVLINWGYQRNFSSKWLPIPCTV